MKADLPTDVGSATVRVARPSTARAALAGLTSDAVRALFVALALLLCACSPSPSPQTGSQTNWLKACDSSLECALGVECVCGVCTRSCQGQVACGDLPDASCVGATDAGSIALCGGQAPPGGLCLPRCEASRCGQGASCVADVCVPAAVATAEVQVDTAQRHQTLVGFGASVSYGDDAIVAHPNKSELYDLLFVESGLDVLRLRNRFRDGSEDSALPTVEIVREASARLGRTPFLFMSSGTPPAELKANASRTCSGDPDVCTLAPLPSGGFDYDGFAGFWRSSLEAYASLGIVPDYISIQNNPSWVPPAAARVDACRFLPEEGTTSVTVGESEVQVRYPGYREALESVQSAIADLPSRPRVGVAETGMGSVESFLAPLQSSSFQAVAIHLTGVPVVDTDAAPLQALEAEAERLGVPVFQTEVLADGRDTAILAHHAFVSAGASVYFQNDIASLASETAPVALVLLTEDGFEPQGPYYALSHYGKRTDPEWVRVDATSGSSALLSSAWLSPDGTALTMILVNGGTEEIDAKLVLDSALRSQFVRTEVLRTVFDGLERMAALGELPANGVVRIPGGSIVTVALSNE